MSVEAPASVPQRDMADAWGAAVEKWIEIKVRGGTLEPQLLDLRDVLPALFDAFVAELFGPSGIG